MNTILLVQALAIGIFSYLGGLQTPWLAGMTGGYYGVGRPLVAGLICGIIMGDITTGVVLGVAVQAAFIANISTGGSTNSEIIYAGYGGIGLGLVSHASTGVTVTLSILVGSLGLILYNIIMVGNSFWNKRAEECASRGDTRGMFINHIIGAQIFQFILRAVPVALAVYFGETFVNTILSIIPQQVISIMNVLGGLLPALGVALLMNLLIQNKMNFIYFFAGFIILTFITKSMIALSVLAVLITFIVYNASGQTVARDCVSTSNIDDDGVI
jgi:Phosphotransferase system, mannose/fructose/N-acetylgalactosamine-specific component IIC